MNLSEIHSISVILANKGILSKWQTQESIMVSVYSLLVIVYYIEILVYCVKTAIYSMEMVFARNWYLLIVRYKGITTFLLLIMNYLKLLLLEELMVVFDVRINIMECMSSRTNMSVLIVNILKITNSIQTT